MKGFVHNESGSIAPFFALTMGVLALLTSLVVHAGLTFLEDRRMQALADLIALVAVRDQDYSADHALSVIEDQGLMPHAFAPILTPGHYTADAGLDPFDRFQPGQRPFNAVRVDLHARIPGEDGRYEVSRLLAEAAAARRDTASFAVGSRLVRVEGGLSGDLLAALTGYDGRITAMDYRALAEMRIDSLDFLNALIGESRIRVLTYDDLLDTHVPPDTVLHAVAAAATETAPAVLDRLAGGALRRARHVRVGDIVEAGAIGSHPVLDGPLGAELSALDLIEATALAANGDHQLALDLDATLAAVRLAIGEHPQSPPVGAASLPGARAETRQLDLLTQLRVGLSNADVRVQAATAEAELTRLRCGPGGRVRADFDVTTSPARLVIETGGLLGQVLALDLGSGERRRVTMTHAHINNGLPETLRSGLGADASLLGLSLPLGALTDPLLTEIDELVENLGAHIAEADLFLRGASCGRPFLIE
jgi:uncharacterized membrane protein